MGSVESRSSGSTNRDMRSSPSTTPPPFLSGNLNSGSATNPKHLMFPPLAVSHHNGSSDSTVGQSFQIGDSQSGFTWIAECSADHDKHPPFNLENTRVHHEDVTLLKGKINANDIDEKDLSPPGVNWMGVESDMGAIFGNHWTIEPNPKLTKKNLLKVEVPDYNVWLGNISKNCVSCLEGLMELRPSHRLGGRNIHALREHPWLRDLGLTNWELLKTKAPDCAPHFMPGKSYIQKKYGHAHPLSSDPSTQQRLIKHLASKEDKDKNGNITPSRITPKQESQFVDFHYSAPCFDYLIAPVPVGLKLDNCLPFMSNSNVTSQSIINSGSSHQLQPLEKTSDANIHMFPSSTPQPSIATLLRDQYVQGKNASISTGHGSSGSGHSISHDASAANGVAIQSNASPHAIQTLAAELKKSNIHNNSVNNTRNAADTAIHSPSFYTGYAMPRPNTSMNNASVSVQHINGQNAGSEIEEEVSYISGHCGISLNANIGGNSSGLFKSNGSRVNGNGVPINHGPSAGNYLNPSTAVSPARKKVGLSPSTPQMQNVKRR